ADGPEVLSLGLGGDREQRLRKAAMWAANAASTKASWPPLVTCWPRSDRAITRRGLLPRARGFEPTRLQASAVGQRGNDRMPGGSRERSRGTGSRRVRPLFFARALTALSVWLRDPVRLPPRLGAG